jgi:hypothetical protein
LRVWIPRITQSAASLASQARALAAAAARRDVRWIDDPTAATATHLLRWKAGEWELFDLRGDIRQIVASPSAAIARLPRRAALFVQFPAPAAMVDDLDVPDTVDSPADADYILAGGYAAGRLEYAWVRPGLRNTDRRTALPARTDWLRHASSRTAPALRDQIQRLRRIHGWHLLESPPEARSPYHLALRHARSRAFVSDRTVIGDERYELVLRAGTVPRLVQQRYVYIFVIDTFGKAFLLFPQSGSVENGFPLTGQENAPREIPLGAAASFEIAPPYGVDSYFLLTTDEPLVSPAVLEWDGVRTRVPRADTALERLLLAINGNTRTAGVHTPANWSIEKLVVESVPPRLQKKLAGPR